MGLSSRRYTTGHQTGPVVEVEAKGGVSHAQEVAKRQGVQLNADRTQDSFAKERRVFDPVIVEGKKIQSVTSTKLNGMTM